MLKAGSTFTKQANVHLDNKVGICRGNCWLDQGNNHQAREGCRSAEEGEILGREGMVVMDEGSSTCKFNGSEVPIEQYLSNKGKPTNVSHCNKSINGNRVLK